MREMKFRVWTGMEMEHRVVAGALGAFYVEGIDPKDSACLSPFNTKYSDQTPVMQFTGLKDKNGKEIYEGDIFEGPYSDRPYSSTKRFQTRRGSVQWNPDQGCIPYPTTGEFEFRFFPEWHECEVIGNIHENPELLGRIE